jgi:hypothetical protein
MGIIINNTSFISNNGSFKSIEPESSPSIPLDVFGQIFRFSGVDLPGFLSPDVNYVNPLDVSSSITILPGTINYVYVKSGSLSDQEAGGPIYVTNMLFTESFNNTSPTTTAFTEELITTPGAGTWTKPVGVTQVIVECWGGGGAGGGATGNPAGGAGGGAGQYSRKYIQYSSPSVGISYSVAAGVTGTNNTVVNGQDTTWATTVVVAKGGTGGTANGTDVTGVPGGIGNQAGSVGDVIYFGGDGEPGLVLTSTPFGGNGGGGAGSISSNISSAGINEYGGAGGAQLNGVSSVGNPGIIYGAGGGGACTNVATNRAGGNGAQGLIRILYR